VSPQAARAAARKAFVGTLAAVGLLAIGTTSVLGGTVARERERGTLAKLLTTRLNALEMVAGKLGAGLIRCAALPAVALPVIVLLHQLGGADAGLLLLAGLGFASLVLFLASLALAVSVESRAEKPALGLAAALAVAWLDLPFLLAVLGPLLFPRVYAWVRPVNLALLNSSPMVVFGHFVGLTPKPSLNGLVARMAAYQAVAGVLLTAWSVARLRPAARRLLGAGDPVGARGRRAWRVRRRPPCGDDPMWWKERYTSTEGPVGVALAAVTYLALLAAFGSVTYYVARPAWFEMWEQGYWSMAPNDLRWEFNVFFLRSMTGVLAIVTVMMVAGQSGEMLDREKSSGSWPVLLATPLTGREILGSKRSRVLRRWWPIILMPVGLWAVGLGLGALHPLGAAAEAAAWFATIRFSSALGAYSSVRAAQAEGKAGPNFALGVCLVTGLAVFLPWALGRRPEPALVAASSPPYLCMLALMSGPEVRALLGGGTPVGVQTLGIAAHPGGAVWTAAAVVLGPALLLLVARWFDRETDRRFDAAVGRTDRDGQQNASADDADGHR
jgi:ABC-type transport system involved in multi-copper enzyme maturation permease subunit